MGVPTPAVGDRPFKIEKTIPSEKEEPKSYLNEQRLKEHERNIERDPKF